MVNYHSSHRPPSKAVQLYSEVSLTASTSGSSYHCFPDCPRNHSPEASYSRRHARQVLCCPEKAQHSPTVPCPHARLSPWPCTVNSNLHRELQAAALTGTALDPAKRSRIKCNLEPKSLSQHSTSHCFQSHWGKDNKLEKIRERARILPQEKPFGGLTVAPGDPVTNPFTKAHTSSSAVFPQEQIEKFS